MSKQLELYKCDTCGTIIELLHEGQGVISCCGKPMLLQSENTVDASREKHVPVIEVSNGATTVKVGSIPHPMEEKHYIAWIELIADGKVYRQRLQPGDQPVATFPVTPASVIIREYCTLHGQWAAGL